MTTKSCIHEYATIGEARVARRLVKALLARELSISVNDGEEWTVSKAWRFKTIMDALCTTGEDYLRVYAPTGDCLGAFYLVWGNAEDGSELISDYTDNDFCDRLCRIAYKEEQKDIFRTVNELLDSRDCVLTGNAAGSEGALYDDSVENLNALRMLEPSLRELVDLCVKGGIQSQCLVEIIDLIGCAE